MMKPTAVLSVLAGALLLSAPAISKPTPAPATPPVGATWAAAAEAPALARPGSYRVGTSRMTVTVQQRPGLGAQGVQTAPFQLPLRLFFPAVAGGRPALYRHTINLPRQQPFSVTEHGIAFEGAAPLAGQTFPLVVFSHGFGGWSEHYSRIAEVLASHGYVVASLDHGDMAFGDVPGFLRSFGNVLLTRPADQRAAIAALLAETPNKGSPMALVDRAKPIGLLGYSMGGYGALGTAGADYDPAAKPYAGLPAEGRALVGQPSPVAGRIGALVLVSPWGGQPDNRAWSSEAVRKVTAPTLLVGGDHDDVVNYAEGIRWIFEHLGGTERRLFTLLQASHNIAGNYAELPLGASADQVGYFREPVWRQERLNQVTTHFIVAFFDHTLRGNPLAKAYLDVPSIDSDKGEWPVKFGEDIGGQLAGDAQPQYWRGFPRRWALGMRLERKGAGE